MRPPSRYTLFPYTTLFRSPVIVPGKAKESKMVAALEGRGASIMPPQKYTLRPGKDEIAKVRAWIDRSEEHTSELQSRQYLVCRLLLEKKKTSECPLLHLLH